MVEQDEVSSAYHRTVHSVVGNDLNGCEEVLEEVANSQALVAAENSGRFLNVEP